MKKQSLSLIGAVVFSLLVFIILAYNVTSYAADGEMGLAEGDTAVSTPPPPNKRTIRSSYSLIYGPYICTDFGDSFSSLNSVWQPGIYTYHYRIVIPDDYPSDVLRVEIFDPDSINRGDDEAVVYHSDTAVNLGFPVSETETCTEDQRYRCLVDTGELALTTSEPPVDSTTINPFWLVRVDENRGAGTPPGDGTCDVPSSYNPGYNTSTLFELYYYAQNPDNTIQRVDLARYTGQTGDNRDLWNGSISPGDHLTDMHWVSPGGITLYDQPAHVPVDPGSPGDFELDLNTDVPSIMIDPYTNKQTIYMDITSQSGASGNGFELWAGPLYPDISSNVNVRNLQLVNDPQAHDPQGVFIEPMGNWPIHSAYEHPYEMALLYIDAELAGNSVFVSLFDSDAGTQPPVTFYFETIPEEDWSMSFGEGDPDPDGVSGRCAPGSCNNMWVDPSYEIKIPGNLDNCDWENPIPEDCTPFSGGYLMVRYYGGLGDTHVWQMSLPRPAVVIEPAHSHISTIPGVAMTHVFTTTWLEMEWMNDVAVTDFTWPTGLVWDATRDALGVTRGTISVTVSAPDTLWVSDTFTLTLGTEPLAFGTTQTTAQPDLTITPVSQTLAGLEDAIITHTLTITNSGDYTDTFNITLSGNQWETVGEATAVSPLAPQASTQVEIYVTVGPDEADTVQVTFTSSNDSAILKSAVFTTKNILLLPPRAYFPSLFQP